VLPLPAVVLPLPAVVLPLPAVLPASVPPTLLAPAPVVGAPLSPAAAVEVPPAPSSEFELLQPKTNKRVAATLEKLRQVIGLERRTFSHRVKRFSGGQSPISVFEPILARDGVFSQPIVALRGWWRGAAGKVSGCRAMLLVSCALKNALACCS